VIIKIVLLLGLTVALSYALLMRRASRFVAICLGGASIVGMYFVLLPERANSIAHVVGVGRGADLVLYCWLVISLIVSVSLQFRLLKQQEAITTLARELALRSAKGSAAWTPTPDTSP
jgi:hypothetical protein